MAVLNRNRSAPVDFSLGVGNTEPLRVTLLQPNNEDGTPGDPYDLTGATVTVTIGPANHDSAAISHAVTIVDAPMGVVQYDWTGFDTSVAGLYELRFKGTLASGVKFARPRDRTGYLLAITADPS